MKTYKRKVLKAPFPYFGGKSKVAPIVWKALGDPKCYIEPFFGSGAVLLMRPSLRSKYEIVNDADGHIANVWRSIQFSSEKTAKYCVWPVNHVDLMARRTAIIKNENRLLENLAKDAEWHDPKMAGYWIWAVSCWIGSGLTDKLEVNKRIDIAHNGRGIHACRQIPHISNNSMGAINSNNVYQWLQNISERLRYVKVVCGDWMQVCGGKWRDSSGICGIYFDPPYGQESNRDKRLYHKDSLKVSQDVGKWCIKHGNKITHRIVLSGYYEEYKELLKYGWSVKKWSTSGGYGNQNKSKMNKNKFKEALFFSPHCLEV